MDISDCFWLFYASKYMTKRVTFFIAITFYFVFYSYPLSVLGMGFAAIGQSDFHCTVEHVIDGNGGRVRLNTDLLPTASVVG